MALIIRDSRGERKITLELNNDEAALIKALLGKCNMSGRRGDTDGLYTTLTKIKGLPEVDLRLHRTKEDAWDLINISYNINRSGV